MRRESCLDTSATNVLSTTNDEVFYSINNEQVSVGIDIRNIAGLKPAIFSE